MLLDHRSWASILILLRLMSLQVLMGTASFIAQTAPKQVPSLGRDWAEITDNSILSSLNI